MYMLFTHVLSELEIELITHAPGHDDRNGLLGIVVVAKPTAA